MQSYLVDEHGSLVARIEAGDHGRMLKSLPDGYSVLIEPPPCDDAWWDGRSWHQVPEQPSPLHTWDKASHAWVLVPLDEARLRAVAMLRARRTSELGAVLVVGSLPFDCSTESRVEIRLRGLEARMAILEGRPWTVRWKLADGRVVDLTAGQMIDAAAAVVARIDAARAAEADARAAVADAATPTAVAVACTG